MSNKKSPSRLAVNSARDLTALQRRMAGLVMQPLTRGDRTAPRSAALAETFIKPNDRLTSLERLELYNRQYWFRVIESITEDFPGLLALLGVRRFNRLIDAYLAAHPSRSYTLRDLGEHLPRFIADHPTLVGPRAKIAVELATLEWAQIIAFDSGARSPVTPADLQGKSPASIRLDLQPYITLLELSYPLDEYLTALNRTQAEHGESSNAVNLAAQHASSKSHKSVRVPRPSPTTVVVHRHQYRVFRKRVHPCAFAMLRLLRDGKSLARALDGAFDGEAGAHVAIEERPAMIGAWFAEWSELGWLTLRGR